MTKLRNEKNPTLGVVVIAKNEERDLPGFLCNVLPWADEVVLVDDASEDRTVKIAVESSPKVRIVDGESCPPQQFDCLRNLGIAQATSDWLLHMDIDERVPAEMSEEIQGAIRSADFDAYRLRRLNFFLNRPMRGGGLQKWNQIHLARREAGRFENAVHETMCLSCSNKRVGQLREPIWHLNDEDYAERMRKSNQYCHLVADEERRSGRSSEWWHMLTRPMIAFVKIYMILGGARDGVPGLIWALHCASAEMRIAILHWESENYVPRESVDRWATHDRRSFL